MSRHAMLAIVAIWIFGSAARADDAAAALRRQQMMELHLRAQERSGLLVPMYIYPADVHTNAAYNRLIDLKRRYETIPVWVIINPASGPGDKVDGNYTKAIDRLTGAGCMTIGYVSTGYGKRPAAQVQRDIDQWLKLYPRIGGIFFDEMRYEDTAAAVAYQADLNRYAHAAGCWPTIGNPGADTPGRYFAASAADVILVHEGAGWPTEAMLKGDYFGGYADYPPFTRAIAVHSQPKLNADLLRMARKYVRWIYVTDAEFKANDPKSANPWSRLSKHLEELFELLSDK